MRSMIGLTTRSFRKKTLRGFTLIDVLLVATLIILVGGLSLGMLTLTQTRNQLDIATQSVVEALRKARVFSQATVEDGEWGVWVASGVVVVFQGSSYISRDIAWDEETTFASTVIPSGQTEMIFARVTGTPLTGATLTLTGPRGESRDIIVNTKGMISY